MTQQLPKRVLGRIGLHVTQLGVGAMEIRDEITRRVKAAETTA